MIYIKSFSNYEEFKDVFGLVEHGNGVKSRKNKILLGALKDRQFVHFCLKMDLFSGLFSSTNMSELKKFVRRYLRVASNGSRTLCFDLPSVFAISSYKYRLDNRNGLCDDFDVECVRYVNNETDRVYKMKAGKFITKLIEESDATNRLPEQIKRWVGEEFAREWKAYATANIPKEENFTLHVGDSIEDFSSIYDSDKCVGDFGSCMVDDGQYGFYVNCVKASAAYITNADGDIVARCVIYDEVTVEETGEILRLAERQYSKDKDDVLKQILIDKLIAEGRIDGYKRIGASCHDAKDFVLNDGTPFRKRMSIENSIDFGDTVSYQDSFKWLDIENGTAYNYEFGYEYVDLAITDDTLPNAHLGQIYCEYDEEWYDEGEVSYDDYNECYIPDRHAASAIYNGREITIDDRRVEDDFKWSNDRNKYIYRSECTYIDYKDDYYLDEDVVLDDYTEEYILVEDSIELLNGLTCLDEDAVWSDYHEGSLYYYDAYWSDLTQDYYVSEDVREEREAAYRAEHDLEPVAV